MAHYQLQMFHQGERVLDVPVAWTPDNAHPPVGSIVDGKWQVVEILETILQRFTAFVLNRSRSQFPGVAVPSGTV